MGSLSRRDSPLNALTSRRMSWGGQPRGRPDRRRRGPSPFTGDRIAAIASLIVVAVIALVIVLGSGGRSTSHTASQTIPGSTGHAAPTSSSRHPAVKPGTASVPILVYHVINAQPASSSANPALYVPADEFSSQMQALKAAGWHAVTLNQLQAYWTRGTPLGTGKPLVITFDNGYASQYTNALPVLKSLGWVGVVNLDVTGLPPSEGGLTTAQIQGLVADGWELDTQGLDPTPLTTVDPTQLTSDLTSARQTLHSQYGVSVNWFSYPSGDYNPTVVAAVRAAGYTGAMTVNTGWASPQQSRFALPGLVVTGGTSSSQLLSQISAAQSSSPVPDSYTGQGVA
jgi:peptidoglycan/xylan/chitin deacetylase (PgdA/CDA1 family)